MFTTYCSAAVLWSAGISRIRVVLAGGDYHRSTGGVCFGSGE